MGWEGARGACRVEGCGEGAAVLRCAATIGWWGWSAAAWRRRSVGWEGTRGAWKAAVKGLRSSGAQPLLGGGAGAQLHGGGGAWGGRGREARGRLRCSGALPLLGGGAGAQLHGKRGARGLYDKMSGGPGRVGGCQGEGCA